MAEQETGKFRQRVESETGGLAKDEEQLYSAAGGLTFEKIEDAVEAAPLALASMADQMLSGAEAGDDDIGDYGVGQLLAEQRSGRAAELLEKARGLAAASQFRPALLAVEEALAADTGSGQAWALKGRCLIELGLHEAALRVLRHARGQVSDPQSRILILKMEADCVRAATRAVEERLLDLIAKQRLSEALGVVEEGLRRQPSNVVFLYHLANVRWLSGDRERAEKAIEEARRHVGRESVDSIDSLERKIEFGPHWEAVEAARLALRRPDHAAAMRQLESCAALEGNEHFDGLRSYAEQKRRTFGQLLGGQLLGARGVSQTGTSRQQTLRWLLAEEIREADGALRAGDYARARAALEKAAKIEPGCGAVCYKHARAIYLSCRKAWEQKAGGDARTATEDLKAAEGLLARAAADADYQEQSQTLLRAIGDLRTRLR